MSRTRDMGKDDQFTVQIIYPIQVQNMGFTCLFFLDKETGQEKKYLVLKRTELTFVEKAWQQILLERP